MNQQVEVHDLRKLRYTGHATRQQARFNQDHPPATSRGGATRRQQQEKTSNLEANLEGTTPGFVQ